MKNEITISLDQVNKINYETLNQFERSVFQDVYENAFRKVELIIKDNQGFRETPILKEDNDEQIDNVISILGKRGVGKTSVMRSFITSLEHCFYGNLSHREKMKQLACFSGASGLTYIGDASFSVLDYIDATLLDEKEGILDVILARMWDKYESICRNARKERRQEILESDLREQFEIVRNSYLFQKRISKGEINESKEISTLRTLHKLAGSMNLRNDFKKLVFLYLDFIHFSDNTEKRKDFLIISIDDIDMASGDVYNYLEQIRRFLTIPQVIVFLTADIYRLKKVCSSRGNRNKLADFLVKEEIEDWRERDNSFVEDYLAKFLPHNSRIYMPNLKEENGINTIIYKIPDKMNKKSLTTTEEKILILQYMAKYLHLYFDGRRSKRHFLQHSTMRNLINYFQSLVDIIENNMEVDLNTNAIFGAEKIKDTEVEEANFKKRKKKLDWYKQDLRYRLMGELLPEHQREEFQQLFYLEPDEINDELIRYIYEYLLLIDEKAAKKYYEEYKKYKADYGLVLRGCYLIERKGVKYRSFVNWIIAFYTLIMTEQKMGMYRESLFLPGGMIQGAWRNSRILLNKRIKQDLQFSESHNMELTIPSDMPIVLEYGKCIFADEIKRYVEKIINKNTESIIAFQMLMLIHKSVIREDPYLGTFPLKVSIDVEFSKKEENNNVPAHMAAEISSQTYKIEHNKVKINKMNVTIISDKLENYKFGLLNFIENINLYFGEEKKEKKWLKKRKQQWLYCLAESIYQEMVDELLKQEITVLGERTSFALSGIESQLLDWRILNWKRRFKKQLALPFDNVEFMYELDKKLHQYRMGIEKTFYQIAKEYYTLIQEELRKQDQYYRDILRIRTTYEECFSKCPYIEVFNSSNKNLQKIFEEKFHNIENTLSKEANETEPTL